MEANLSKRRQSLHTGQLDQLRHVGAVFGSANHYEIPQSISDQDLDDARVPQQGIQAALGDGSGKSWNNSDRRLYQKKSHPWDNAAAYRAIKSTETAFGGTKDDLKGSHTSSKRVETGSRKQN